MALLDNPGGLGLLFRVCVLMLFTASLNDIKSSDAVSYLRAFIENATEICSIVGGSCVAPKDCHAIRFGQGYGKAHLACNNTLVCCYELVDHFNHSTYNRTVNQTVYEFYSKHKPAHSRQGLIHALSYKADNRTALCELINGTCTEPMSCSLLNNYQHVLGHGKKGLETFGCNVSTICCYGTPLSHLTPLHAPRKPRLQRITFLPETRYTNRGYSHHRHARMAPGRQPHSFLVNSRLPIRVRARTEPLGRIHGKELNHIITRGTAGSQGVYGSLIQMLDSYRRLRHLRSMLRTHTYRPVRRSAKSGYIYTRGPSVMRSLLKMRMRKLKQDLVTRNKAFLLQMRRRQQQKLESRMRLDRIKELMTEFSGGGRDWRTRVTPIQAVTPSMLERQVNMLNRIESQLANGGVSPLLKMTVTDDPYQPELDYASDIGDNTPVNMNTLHRLITVLADKDTKTQSALLSQVEALHEAERNKQTRDRDLSSLLDNLSHLQEESASDQIPAQLSRPAIPDDVLLNIAGTGLGSPQFSGFETPATDDFLRLPGSDVNQAQLEKMAEFFAERPLRDGGPTHEPRLHDYPEYIASGRPPFPQQQLPMPPFIRPLDQLSRAASAGARPPPPGENSEGPTTAWPGTDPPQVQGNAIPGASLQDQVPPTAETARHESSTSTAAPRVGSAGTEISAVSHEQNLSDTQSSKTRDLDVSASDFQQAVLYHVPLLGENSLIPRDVDSVDVENPIKVLSQIQNNRIGIPVLLSSEKKGNLSESATEAPPQPPRSVTTTSSTISPLESTTTTSATTTTTIIAAQTTTTTAPPSTTRGETPTTETTLDTTTTTHSTSADGQKDTTEQPPGLSDTFLLAEGNRSNSSDISGSRSSDARVADPSVVRQSGRMFDRRSFFPRARAGSFDPTHRRLTRPRGAHLGIRPYLRRRVVLRHNPRSLLRRPILADKSRTIRASEERGEAKAGHHHDSGFVYHSDYPHDVDHHDYQSHDYHQYGHGDHDGHKFIKKTGVPSFIVSDFNALCVLKSGECMLPSLCSTDSIDNPARFACNITTICCLPQEKNTAYHVKDAIGKKIDGAIRFEEVTDRNALCVLKGGTCQVAGICNPNHVDDQHDHQHDDHNLLDQSNFFCNLTHNCCLPDKFEVTYVHHTIKGDLKDTDIYHYDDD